MPDALPETRISITWTQVQRFWFYLSLAVIITALPFSKLGLSIGQMMLAGGWIEKRIDYRRLMDSVRSKPLPQAILLFLPCFFGLVIRGIVAGFKEFFLHRDALIFSSIFLLHILGLLTTTDFDYAFKDLRTKIPLLLLPLLISTSAPIGRKAFYNYLLLFGAALFCRTTYNAWMIVNGSFIDIRDVARNVSHIILSLLLVLAIFSQLYLSVRRGAVPRWLKVLLVFLSGWFIFYLFYSQSFTGVSILVISIFATLFVVIIRTGKLWVRAGMFISMVAVVLAVFLSLRSVTNDFYRVNPMNLKTLDKVSARGNPYINDTTVRLTENGNHVWIYVQMEEMREVWNRRSAIPFDSLNRKNEICAFTVIRFLASKGWRKDADAVERLTPEEIGAIEKGIPNYLFIGHVSLRARIYEFLWGFENYRQTGNPTGSTIMQRLEFWKASAGIIRDNWITGVGTGDMNIAFDRQYNRMHTKLAHDQRWRSHNQFLSILVGFGIFGLLWFLIAVYAPPLMSGFDKDFFLRIFLLIATLSMLTEDTIESQTGVTFFAFFYSFFLFARKERETLTDD